MKADLFFEEVSKMIGKSGINVYVYIDIYFIYFNINIDRC